MNFVQKPAYKGYKAYEYLEEGKDYPKIEWAQWDWAGRHVVELEPDQEAMVQEILKKHPYISLHDHPTFYPKDMSSIDHIYDSMRQGRAICGYEALSYSNIDCIFDNMMDGVNIISSPGGWKWIDIIHDLGMRLCDLAHQDFLIQCKTVDDIFAAKKAGKIAWVPCIEGAAPIENEVDRIDILYGLGVRQLGVTYSESNALGNGMKEDHDGGLTMFGKQCVERMNKVGMLIDVSHCGQQTAYDAVMYSKKPIIMSHVGAKGVWDIKRMAGDDLIKAIGAKGGVVGIESAPHTTMSKTKMTHDLDSFMEHFEEPDRHRPRWFWRGLPVRRPCRRTPRLCRRPVYSGNCEYLLRGSALRLGSGESHRSQLEHHPLAGKAQLQRRGHRQGHRRQRHPGAAGSLGLTVLLNRSKLYGISTEERVSPL